MLSSVLPHMNMQGQEGKEVKKKQLRVFQGKVGPATAGNVKIPKC